MDFGRIAQNRFKFKTFSFKNCCKFFLPFFCFRHKVNLHMIRPALNDSSEIPRDENVDAQKEKIKFDVGYLYLKTDAVNKIYVLTS